MASVLTQRPPSTTDDVESIPISAVLLSCGVAYNIIVHRFCDLHATDAFLVDSTPIIAGVGNMISLAIIHTSAARDGVGQKYEDGCKSGSRPLCGDGKSDDGF